MDSVLYAADFSNVVAIRVAGRGECTITTMCFGGPCLLKNRSGLFSGFERLVIVISYSLMGRGDGGHQLCQHSRPVSYQVKVRTSTSSGFQARLCD